MDNKKKMGLKKPLGGNYSISFWVNFGKEQVAEQNIISTPRVIKPKPYGSMQISFHTDGSTIKGTNYETGLINVDENDSSKVDIKGTVLRITIDSSSSDTNNLPVSSTGEFTLNEPVASDNESDETKFLKRIKKFPVKVKVFKFHITNKVLSEWQSNKFNKDYYLDLTSSNKYILYTI